MPGTIGGGKKAAITTKRRNGEDFYKTIGRMGGLQKVPKGFALNKDLASRAGKIGGKVSRRTKKVIIVK